MNNNNITTDLVDELNELLRGERSAVETYDITIDRFNDEPKLNYLREIRREHLNSQNLLINRVREMGGTPDSDSGFWGTFATTIQKASSFIGKESAIDTLIRGEKHGVSEYEDALEDDDVDASTKQLIRDSLLPQLRRHITALEAIEERVD